MRVEQIGSATLILGDCRDALDRLRPAACVLTDPPFGIAYQSGYRTDALWCGHNIIGDATTATRDEVLQALAGPATLAFGSRKAPPPPGTRAVLIWDKGPALGMGALDIPWKPSWEEIYVLGRGFAGGRGQGAVIYCPPVQSMAANGRLHPNEKPVVLLRRLMQNLPPGLLADPFMGSASTAEACILEGRPFVGCEVDARYFDIACRRIERVARQTDLLMPAIQQPQLRQTHMPLESAP